MAPRSISLEQIPEPVRELCGRLEAAGYGAWVVGGCIRDLLLGRAVNDWDVATSARPEQVRRVFRRVIPTGIAHGTVTVMLDGEPYEVTTLRGEGAYTDGRRPDEVFFVDGIEEDLARRDFTVNAIAYAPGTDVLIDPYGGLEDLSSRCLRAVGVASERFAEDGLRILRGARFVATLEMQLEAETLRAMGLALDTYRKVSHERVRDEWLKAMKATRPSRAFEVMRRVGILKVTLPELLQQVGCEQNRWHTHPVWEHTLATLDACPADPLLRLAALLHDLGKPESRGRSEKTGDYTFYNHERIGARMAERWLRQFRFSNTERQTVVGLIRNHLICYDPSWSDGAVRRFMRRVGAESIPRLIELARADALGKGRSVEQELANLSELEARIEQVAAAGAALGVKDLALRGDALMSELGLSPGPRVGAILRALLERVLEDPELNTRDHLLALAAEEIAREGDA
ncbi:MAG: CCA tRNA nucleotidyltransferase [Deltaproteobacteria bacterium]|nr:CCA tRNA nucleotidyltransferase [Deltaproteobacteria bacterium]